MIDFRTTLLALFSLAIASVAFPQKYRLTNSTPPDPALATGFVHVKQIDGIWWFIGPEGQRFISMGVNHIEPHLWLAPYNKEATLQKYGAEMVDADGYFNTHGAAAQKWIDRQIEICRDLHFNTFAKHTHDRIAPKLYKDDIYYIVSLETAPLSGWRQRKGQGPRPDVFSIEYRQHVEDIVRKITEVHKDSPKLLGYLYTDVPSWQIGKAEQKANDNFTMIYPWVNEILGLNEAAAGKQRWIAHLKSRYPKPEDAAKTWGFEISPTYGIKWDQMARLSTWFDPTDEKKAKEDMSSFLSLIADQYYSLHREIILKHDPNHLLLGDKNILQWHYDYVLPAIKKHVDVIAVQTYGRWETDAPLYDKVYTATGKPIFNGDGCYSFPQETQTKWGIKGFRTGAKSIEDVAALYRETVEGMMSKPYIVGWHHCGYLEQWDPAERGDSPRNENGFLTPFEKYRKTWTDTIKDINSKVVELHSAAK